MLDSTALMNETFYMFMQQFILRLKGERQYMDIILGASLQIADHILTESIHTSHSLRLLAITLNDQSDVDALTGLIIIQIRANALSDEVIILFDACSKSGIDLLERLVLQSTPSVVIQLMYSSIEVP